MINVVDYLVEAGLLMNSSNVGEESLETLRAEHLDAPRTIRQLIERNLERLKPEEQAVLEGASVAGVEFSAASIAAALERPQTEIEACCTRLSRHEQFISTQGPVTWPDGTIAAGFRFHHALYQEVLYDRLSVSHRLQLHQRIAAREEMGYGDRTSEVATELARHYTLANVKNKAIQYLRVAGERAVNRGAAVEAEKQYRCALKLLLQLPEDVERDRQELAIQIALGVVLWSSRSWGHTEATRAYKRALELGEKLEDTIQLVMGLVGLGQSTLGSGQFKLTRELAERTLVAAESCEDAVTLGAAHTCLGEALFFRGEFIEAQKHLVWGMNNYNATDSGQLALFGLKAPAGAAVVALLTGFPDRARQLMAEALRRSERRDDPFWGAVVHVWGAQFAGMLHDGPACNEHAQALRRAAAKSSLGNNISN
jgi:hypothetical protein